MSRWIIANLVLIASVVSLGGCGSPSAANIALRIKLQKRDDEIAKLKRQHTADQADLVARRGPTTQSLSSEKLASLYTTHGIKIGKLTGETKNGFRVEVTPTDEDGQSLKAAGSFDVSLFDLADKGTSIGEWKFDEAAARSNWLGSAFMYAYVLPCPLKQPPAHSDLTVRVTFTDALTGRQFTEQKEIDISPPPASQP
ncbi:MAG: hypothetical protein JO353_11825 [Phycisphaerae bacterium]|nr:hypothetical protein [Phycisphaerae bacterium]